MWRLNVDNEETKHPNHRCRAFSVRQIAAFNMTPLKYDTANKQYKKKNLHGYGGCHRTIKRK